MPEQLLLSQISFKSLKAVDAVAQTMNVTRAAEYLNRSQTAVSKALKLLEDKLDARLFDRTTAGMTLTPKGVVLHAGIQEALQQFRLAACTFREMVRNDASIENSPMFNLGVSYNCLHTLRVAQKTANFKDTAQQMHSSTTSIYNAIHLMEQMLDTTLFERNVQGNGNKPSPYCEVLSRHVRLALLVLQNALDEVTNDSGQASGAVTISAMPSIRNVILPQACVQLKRENPNVRIMLKDGIYRDLEWQLRCGELDFILCAFYKPEQQLPEDLEQFPLFTAPLQMLVRAGHPLLEKGRLGVDDLRALSWLLPPNETHARKRFEHLLSSVGIEQPHCQIEAYSYSIISELLQHSNSVALAFSHQYGVDIERGVLAVLPIQFNEPVTIGMVLRRHTTLSKQARFFKEALVDLSLAYNLQ